MSLDSVDPATFAAMGDTKVPLSVVLDGIEVAAKAGFAPVKLNAVVQRGVNDDGIVDLARYAREGGHILRFIEYMDVGSSNGWTSGDVVPASEILGAHRRCLPDPHSWRRAVPVRSPSDGATKTGAARSE